MTALDRVIDGLLDEPIGWLMAGEDTPWPPARPHGHHLYDARCAICRAGDRPEALAALVAAVCAIANSHQILVTHELVSSTEASQ